MTLLLIGAGHMGGALLKGWLEAGRGPVTVVEPRPAPWLRKRREIALIASIEDARGRYAACVVALKPQILKVEAARLAPVAARGTLMISIAAGTTLASLAGAWGREARIVRAMPNLPGQIGKGISALYAPRNVTAAQKRLARSLLAALGQTVWVSREGLIDSVTAVSGSGPAYVFLLVEALEAAARAQGLPAEAAKALARATVAGAGALLESDPRQAAALRAGVTSPGGTTQAALEVLMAKDGLARLMARAVAAANRRAKELGR
ncbi:MAG TPA: pyrroline-5-carboxylate reductase [Rhizomicrobium sp.]|nr:pyrroline-5-carboxylate reductase [Rhizomicrobium sp.]